MEKKYYPKTKKELQEIIDKEIESQGGINVDLNCIDTSEITNMSELFYNRGSLETLDLSKWDVSNVEGMQYMFEFCISLKELDLSNWDVSGVCNMTSMFGWCEKLTSTGDLSKWDVSNVVSMREMFGGCETLTFVGDLSKWDVSKVEIKTCMFYKCPAKRPVGRLKAISKDAFSPRNLWRDGLHVGDKLDMNYDDPNYANYYLKVLERGTYICGVAGDLSVEVSVDIIDAGGHKLTNDEINAILDKHKVTPKEKTTIFENIKIQALNHKELLKPLYFTNDINEEFYKNEAVTINGIDYNYVGSSRIGGTKYFIKCE